MGLYDYRNQLYKDNYQSPPTDDEKNNKLMQQAQARNEKLRQTEQKNINRNREVQEKAKALPSLPTLPTETKKANIPTLKSRNETKTTTKNKNIIYDTTSDTTNYFSDKLKTNKDPVALQKVEDKMAKSIQNNKTVKTVAKNVAKPMTYGYANALIDNIVTPIAKATKSNSGIEDIAKFEKENQEIANQNAVTKASNFVGDMGTNMLLYKPIYGLTGLNAATNKVGNAVTSKLGGGALAKIGGAAAREGLENGLLSATTQLPGLVNGYDSGSDYAKKVGSEVLGGAIFGGGLQGIGEVGKGVLKGVQNSKLDLGNIKEGSTNSLKNPEIDLNTPKTVSELPKIETITNSAKAETPIVEPKSEVKIESSRDIDKLLNNTTKIPNEIATTKLEDNKGLSRFKTITVDESPNVSQELKDINKKVDVDYDKISDKEALEVARERIKQNESKAISDILTLQRDKKNGVSKYDVTTGIELMRQLQAKGDPDSLSQASDISIKLSEELTKAGQTIQAASILNKLTPEGFLVYANKQLKKANDILPKEAKKLELSKDEVKQITDLMKKAQELPEGREKTVLLAKAHKVYQDKIPSSLMDKIDSFRYINMLFNPKTLIKNGGGNAINLVANNIRDMIATPIDKAISNKTGIRTTGLGDIKTQGQGLAKGWKENLDDYKQGVDTSHSNREGTRRNALKGIPILGKVEDLLSTALGAGDRPFFQSAHDNFLNNYMKLNKINDVSSVPSEVLDEAVKVGLEATYQQKTPLANWISQGKNSNSKALSTGVKAVLPFSQTPSAILDTAINYTPIGALRGANNIKQAITGEGFFPKFFGSSNVGPLTAQRKGVNQLASSILGGGIMAGGSALANNGKITGALSDDKDTRNLQKQTGLQEYAAKIGDTYNSLEFAQPVAMPLMIGADMSKNGLSPSNIGTGINSLMDNSYLSGIANLGRTIGQQGWLEGLKQVGGDYMGQLQPFSALSNQINKTISPTMVDTEGDSFLSEQLNKAQSKIPVLSQMLPKALDTVGNTKENSEGMNLFGRALNNFINPSNTTLYTPSDVEQNALDMYNNDGSTNQMPHEPQDTMSLGKGKEYTLTVEDKRLYKQMVNEALENANKTPEDYEKAIRSVWYDLKEIIKRRN